MSRQINQPVNQVRLTNVAVVRMNKHGKRFEIACYRNKAVNYRQGIETDLSEVLQTDRIFTNVSKGEFAKTSDLQLAFDTTNEEEICRIIISHGQLQISDMERSAYLENKTREVAVMISEKCIDPTSNRPYTVETIRDAMREAEFAVHLTKSTKQQFLECVKLLKTKAVLPIERARMHLCAHVPLSVRDAVLQSVMECGAEPIHTSQGDDLLGKKETDVTKIEFLIDPSIYRNVDGKVKELGLGKGRLDIVFQCVYEKGDVGLDSEMARKDRLAAEAGKMCKESHLNKKDGENGITTIDVSGRTNGEGLSDSDEGATSELGYSRKVQKKAQKKSKKAKRREKEEACERQQRMDAELERQEERAIRMMAGADLQNEENEPTEYSTGQPSDSLRKSCNTCGGLFTATGYRAHFRSDWHRYNQKLKLAGTSCISEEEFKLVDAGSFFDKST